jgi:hypothetical protein
LFTIYGRKIYTPEENVVILGSEVPPVPNLNRLTQLARPQRGFQVIRIRRDLQSCSPRGIRQARAARSLLWMLALGGACRGQAATVSSNSDLLSPAYLLLCLLVPLVILIVRRSLVDHLRKQMMLTSENSQAFDSEEDEKAAAGVVRSRKRLEVAIHDSGEPIAGNNSRLRGEKRLFLRTCLTDLGIALGYAGLPRLFGASADQADTGTLMAWFMTGFSVFHYLLYHRQFQAFNLGRSRRLQPLLKWLGRLFFVVGGLIVYGRIILRAIVAPRMRMAFAVVLPVLTLSQIFSHWAVVHPWGAPLDCSALLACTVVPSRCRVSGCEGFTDRVWSSCASSESTRLRPSSSPD